MQIKISEIKINPGRRDTQQRNVEELARSIAAVGLMNPITVTQDNTLIAGLHRLEAVKLLVCHYSSGMNNVVLTEFTASGFTSVGRQGPYARITCRLLLKVMK